MGFCEYTMTTHGGESHRDSGSPPGHTHNHAS
ncbi:MAG: hypothetical protein J07HX5_00342, partial [halophilic archaeon J07HX5]